MVPVLGSCRAIQNELSARKDMKSTEEQNNEIQDVEELQNQEQ